MRILAVVTALMLGACTTVKPIMAPSGAQGYMVWCEMPSQCYERAAEACPKGYVIEADVKDYFSRGDVDGNLIIVCK